MYSMLLFFRNILCYYFIAHAIYCKWEKREKGTERNNENTIIKNKNDRLYAFCRYRGLGHVFYATA